MKLKSKWSKLQHITWFQINDKISDYNNFANIKAIDMKHISLESSWWDKSNRAKIIEIQVQDPEIISKISKYLNNVSTVNIDITNIILPPFDSA